MIDERCPVVLLSTGDASGLGAVRIVAPATTDEKRGFLVLSGAEAADAGRMRQRIEAAGPAVGGIGVEVAIGAAEGLSPDGVVRVALPRQDTVYCTWLTTLTPEYLQERIGVLSAAKLQELDNALRLSAVG